MNTKINLFGCEVPFVIKQGIVTVSETDTRERQYVVDEGRHVTRTTPGQMVMIPGTTHFIGGTTLTGHPTPVYIPGSTTSQYIPSQRIESKSYTINKIKVRTDSENLEYPIPDSDRLTTKDFKVGDRVLLASIGDTRFFPVMINNSVNLCRTFVIEENWKESVRPLITKMTGCHIPEYRPSSYYTETPEINESTRKLFALENERISLGAGGAIKALLSLLGISTVAWLVGLFRNVQAGAMFWAWVWLVLADLFIWLPLFSPWAIKRQRMVSTKRRIDKLRKERDVLYEEAHKREKQANAERKTKIDSFLAAELEVVNKSSEAILALGRRCQ